MKKFLAISLIFGTAAGAFADATDVFEQANRAFAEGKYEEAIEEYEFIFQEEGISANLLVNLANAQFRVGKIGSAVLDYERALYLNPRDPNAAANLKIVRGAGGLQTPELAWWQTVGRLLSWNEWAWLSLFSLLGLITTAVARFVGLPKPGSLHKWLRLSDGALVFVLLAASLGVWAHWLERDRAVVVAENAVARISPFENANVAFPLAEGELVSLRQAHGPFVFLQNFQGKSGWLPQDQIERIVPTE